MSDYTHFARYYDELTQNVEYAKRAAYVQGIIQKYLPNARLVLDLACGTGSLSMELTALGYEVIGVDRSRDMLAVAQQKAFSLEQEGRPLFLCQSMEDLDLYGTVDVCVCALDSLNHLPDEDALERVLERVALFLNPGGLLLFDVNTPYKHRSILGNQTFVYDLPGVYCVWQNSLRKDLTVDISLDFFAPEASGRYRRFSETFSERIFPHDTLCTLLSRTGFSTPSCYAEDTEEAPGPETQRVVYMATLERSRQRETESML